MNESSTPLVTYIVLSYNHEKYVTKAIESIINQDYPRLQLIVVDDGSTDGSIELLNQLKNRYGFELITQKNQGVVSALNKGISLAKGVFIVPHASDDESLSNRTKEQVSVFLNNSNVGFTVGGIRKIDEYGNILDEWTAHEKKVFSFHDFLSGRAKAIAISCMYDADAIKAIGKLDCSLTFEDVQLFWRVTELGYNCVYDTSIKATYYRILTTSLGRRNKIPHHESFVKFLENYKNYDGYRAAKGRGLAGLFNELAQVDRAKSIWFLLKNILSINLILCFRGGIKLVLPKKLVLALKKKH